MAEDIWRVHISAQMRAKINNANHRLTEDDVRHACANVIAASWNHDAERGRRLYVLGRTESGGRAIVVLYPTDEYGLWNLGTARRA